MTPCWAPSSRSWSKTCSITSSGCTPAKSGTAPATTATTVGIACAWNACTSWGCGRRRRRARAARRERARVARASRRARDCSLHDAQHDDDGTVRESSSVEPNAASSVSKTMRSPPAARPPACGDPAVAARAPRGRRRLAPLAGWGRSRYLRCSDQALGPAEEADLLVRADARHVEQQLHADDALHALRALLGEAREGRAGRAGLEADGAAVVRGDLLGLLDRDGVTSAPSRSWRARPWGCADDVRERDVGRRRQGVVDRLLARRRAARAARRPRGRTAWRTPTRRP